MFVLILDTSFLTCSVVMVVHVCCVGDGGSDGGRAGRDVGGGVYFTVVCRFYIIFDRLLVLSKKIQKPVLETCKILQ